MRSFYFSHDSNAHDDPKCMFLIDQLNLEGYGIFWLLIEILREQPNYRYPMALLPVIAKKYNSSSQKFEIVVKNYGLFQIENDEFFSLSLNKRMQKMEKEINKKRESGRKGGIASAENRKKLIQKYENELLQSNLQNKTFSKDDSIEALLGQCSSNAPPIKE